MSHELHLSKLIKRLIFSCFHFHHPQYLAGKSLRNKLLLGPWLKTTAVRRLLRNAAVPWWSASLLGAPACLLRPAQELLALGGTHSRAWPELKAPSLAWLWPV